MAAYRDANRKKAYATVAAWKKANPEYVKNYATSWRTRLAPSYVSKLLGLRVEDLTPELLALKREQLEIHRLARLAKTTLKELSNETSTDSE